ncbi:hypothetical protein NDU88_001900 [Pleurodeles waltl]|uniref:Uncharacterized protein n=1 Tax=Pleurodeles waltl TaxID=8319 RepID=A0AAV7VXQ0_PLEWA|nr:hypothetical protein NDU88_001900 [Pleurodeles waltl]
MAPEHPAPDNGSLRTAQYPGGTAGAGKENGPLRNPDIRISIVEKGTGCLLREAGDVEANAPGEEDVAGKQGQTGQEDTEPGPHREQRHREQLTPRETLEEGRGSSRYDPAFEAG